MSKIVRIVLAALAVAVLLSGCHWWTHQVVHHDRGHHHGHGPHR
jgi:hypothetical protein